MTTSRTLALCAALAATLACGEDQPGGPVSLTIDPTMRVGERMTIRYVREDAMEPITPGLAEHEARYEVTLGVEVTEVTDRGAIAAADASVAAWRSQPPWPPHDTPLAIGDRLRFRVAGGARAVERVGAGLGAPMERMLAQILPLQTRAERVDADVGLDVPRRVGERWRASGEAAARRMGESGVTFEGPLPKSVWTFEERDSVEGRPCYRLTHEVTAADLASDFGGASVRHDHVVSSLRQCVLPDGRPLEVRSDWRSTSAPQGPGSPRVRYVHVSRVSVDIEYGGTPDEGR